MWTIALSVSFSVTLSPTAPPQSRPLTSTHVLNVWGGAMRISEASFWCMFIVLRPNDFSVATAPISLTGSECEQTC